MWKETRLPIFNTCLINRRVPESWKGALIHRIPTNDNVPNDPSTWRDFSLLTTIYKVFMKCVLRRILPWLVDANILSTEQKAYIEKQGMNEHVSLKNGYRWFQTWECKIQSSFFDAFGTLPGKIMIRALEEIHLPQVYTDIIKDVYKSSFIWKPNFYASVRK